jgi:hypothetical protein
LLKNKNVPVRFLETRFVARNCIHELGSQDPLKQGHFFKHPAHEISLSKEGVFIDFISKISLSSKIPINLTEFDNFS